MTSNQSPIKPSTRWWLGRGAYALARRHETSKGDQMMSVGAVIVDWGRVGRLMSGRCYANYIGDCRAIHFGGLL